MKKTTLASGWLRRTLFPIRRDEMNIFLPMGLMMFFILFNYTVLRDVKDTLVVGAAGGEAISLVKLIGSVPGAILIMMAYAKLSNVLPRDKIFYLAVGFFMLFFGGFAYVLYPNQASLQPSDEIIEGLFGGMPRLRTLGLVLKNWDYALFYVLSELWGSVILSLLFWQLANESVQMGQAKRFYPLFGVIANLGAIGAGASVNYFANLRENFTADMDPWGYTLNYLMGAVALSSIGLMMTYRWVSKKGKAVSEQPRKQKKMALKDSFLYLIKSRHLGLVSLLVICYGVSINVMEAVWKNEVKFLYGNFNEYSAFMGKYSMITGVVTICCMLLGGVILRKCGWLFSAALTPLLILFAGTIFFYFVTFKDSLEPTTLALFGVLPSVFVIWLGFVQAMACKSTKYSLFDPTKEMCYIPLDDESKVKGKAAIDVVGSRLGKSGGSFIQQFFLISLGGSLAELSPYLGVVVVLTVVVWLAAVKGLAGRLNFREPSLQLAKA